MSQVQQGVVVVQPGSEPAHVALALIGLACAVRSNADRGDPIPVLRPERRLEVHELRLSGGIVVACVDRPVRVDLSGGATESTGL